MPSPSTTYVLGVIFLMSLPCRKSIDSRSDRTLASPDATRGPSAGHISISPPTSIEYCTYSRSSPSSKTTKPPLRRTFSAALRMSSPGPNGISREPPKDAEIVRQMMQRTRKREQQPVLQRQTRGARAENQRGDVVNRPERRKKNHDRAGDQKRMNALVFDPAEAGFHAIPPPLPETR